MGKGLKSVSTLSARQIAKKHGLSLAYIAKQIAKGVKVEKEHTKSTKEANEIARDHLGERPDYYIKLDKMEKTKVINELGEYDNKGGSPVVGDLTGSSRKVSKVDEGKRLDKAKKAVMAGVTAANMYTMADVAGRASEGGHGSPKADIVRAASALPGAAGWGATAVHYGKKGYDLARDALKKKKATMEEEKKMPNPCWKGYKAYGMKKKNGKEVPNCVPVEEESDAADETNMAKTQLKAMSSKANNLQSKLKSPKNLPGWVQSKIAVAKDGITSVDDYMTHSDKINEISAELVGKVSNARFWRGEAPSKTLTRAINKKFIESGKKKENVKKQTVKEELMDTKEQIHEAIGNIMEENLHEMKENFLAVLQEKAIEKLEERKKEIAANYFAQD